MKKYILMLIFVLFFIGSLSASEIIKGKSKFRIDLDVAKFYGDEAQVYVEVYYGIPENCISYKIDSNKITGVANVKMIIQRDSAVISLKDWSVPHVIEDTSRLMRGQTMFGLESFALPVGNYQLTVVAYDFLDASRRDNFMVPLFVSSFASDKEALSDIELCTSIQSSTNKKSIFYKNTLEVNPNASKLYGIGLPILYYYAEAYNLMIGGHRNDFIVRSAVIDIMGNEVIHQEKTKKRTINSSVEIGTMNLSALRGGTYVFRLSLMDTVIGVLTSSEKKFFVYRPPLAGESPSQTTPSGVTSSEYAVMTQAEVDQEFAYIRYIISETEREQYGRLTDLDAKRKFLYEFWGRRVVNSQSAQNDFKAEYKKRVDYANQNLSIGLREGWKTDRGRVYIVYGPSDEIERFPSTAESSPYEIWHYNNLQGGVIFVFVDRNGMSDYVLVHSTHRDELRNPNWYQEDALKTR